MTLKSGAKFEEKLTCGLENDMINIRLILEHLKVSKLGLWWNPLIRSRKCMNLNLTEELCVMAMKDDAKFEEELTFCFKIDIRNVINFDPSTQKSQNFNSNGLLLSKA